MSLRRMSSAVVVGGVAVALAAAPAAAQLEPIPQDRGASGLGLALRRLPVTSRVLYVTAHPDDEHNGVLVRLSRGQGVRTALLTLTRGDGGQNEIGTELFQALGVLRTEELAAVHRHDRAEQYFTRAYEFGYSFSVEETLERWGHQATLGDVVKVVRTFRPDVILTLPLESPGGGQHHQAAARLAVEAFRAAADPTRFPEQLQAGLRPWQARKVYQGGTGGELTRLGDARAVVLDTGVYDPLLGQSWQELGSLARSFHKCQGMRQLAARPGGGQGWYYLVDAEPMPAGPETDVLDGIDGTIPGLLRLVRPEQERVAWLAGELERLAATVAGAAAAFDPAAPEETVPSLTAALQATDRIRRQLRESGLSQPARLELDERLARKQVELHEALALAHGLALEVLADDDLVVPGETFGVTLWVWNQGALPVALDEVRLAAPPGWKVTATEGGPGALPSRQSLRMRFDVSVGPDARHSQPYWRLVPGRDRYAVDVEAHDTLPWSPPDLVAQVRYTSRGAPAEIAAPAIWRYEGRWVGGEKRKVVGVVPPVSVRLSPEVVVLPASGTPVRRELRATVRNDSREAGTGQVRLEAPPGWRVEPSEVPLRFSGEGDEASVRFFVTTPPGLAEGTYELQAVAVRNSREFRDGYQVVAYDHVQERLLFRPATARALAFDVRVAPGVRLGYVHGAGDEVPEAIRQLGLELDLLGPDDLAFGDLARYSTVVTGIRAYQTRPDLRAHHARLIEYVAAGGHLVVQYNKFELNQASLARATAVDPPPGPRGPQPDSPFTPYPAAVGSGRVTDEAAPVEVLVPDSPLLREPNRLGDADWAGWVQERGLYFLESRDPRYVELLALTDPFPKNPGRKTGALVEARVGKGTWTYVGLGLFRQLPAGTPGAYRLLANLLSRPRGR